MADLNTKNLKFVAAQRLSQTSADPKKLVLIHTGLIVILNLLVNGLNLLLSEQIGATGGLGGLGLRSVLETAQTILGYFSALFTPFWIAGFLFAMVSIARGLDAQPKDLMQGFKRFGHILSYVFWQMLILVFLCFGLMYLVSFIFMMTPFAQDFMEILMPLMERGDFLLSDGTINMDLLPIEELFMAMIPMLVMYAAVLIPVYAWINYHLRMTNFLLVEGESRGAMSCMLVSIKMMKGHKWQMLKLDLSFWWYYVLGALLTVVLYLDVILPMLGVALPINATAAYFITIALYGVLELGLHLWKKPEVDVTYASAYDAIYQEALEFLQMNPIRKYNEQ